MPGWRDEPAIAVAEHDGLFTGGGFFQGLRHSVGNIGETAADGLRPSKTRQFGHDDPERLR
jgi:hypothetical protein